MEIYGYANIWLWKNTHSQYCTFLEDLKVNPRVGPSNCGGIWGGGVKLPPGFINNAPYHEDI
jgi:hypothetical protein